MGSSVKFIPGNRAGITEDPIKAGIIEVRPGTKGIDLGEQRYGMAYIRVLDEFHYLKGMCVYSNNLPENYDVIRYCFDPRDCLYALKDEREDKDIPKKLNKGIMTKIKSPSYDEWMEWREK